MTQPSNPREIPNNAGNINERLMRRFGMTDLGRIESAHRAVPTSLYSPEGKRSFMRMFHPMQINVHFITHIARMGLPNDVVEKAEKDLRKMLDTAMETIQKGTVRVERKLKGHGIEELASYHLPAVSQDVLVFSGFGKRYLELIAAFDHLMLMIETLAVDDAVTHSEAAQLKVEFKKPIRSVAQAARLTRNRLHRAFHDPDASVAERGAEGGSGAAGNHGEGPGTGDEAGPGRDGDVAAAGGSDDGDRGSVQDGIAAPETHVSDAD